MSSDIEDFPTVFVQAVKAVTGEEIDEENWYEYFGEDTDDGCYLSEELSGLGHKMLGYPGLSSLIREKIKKIGNTMTHFCFRLILIWVKMERIMCCGETAASPIYLSIRKR